jgi:hypothetical protein
VLTGVVYAAAGFALFGGGAASIATGGSSGGSTGGAAGGPIDLYALFGREFKIVWPALIPAVVILVLSLLHVRVQLAMSASILSAIPICLAVQSVAPARLAAILFSGYHAADAEVAAMIDGGGIVSMLKVAGIVCLSAYCGATSAGCGAAAGITYLYGGRAHAISHTIVNAVAINSGMICDGAKPSCAAKIASAVEAGLLGMQMQKHGVQFFSGEGIVVKGVENTIRNVSKIARVGMKETDVEIIKLMTNP